jgi:2-keto-4-pentenoate hydratase/2-oxohepta-3-ene-1,7-dioic acid hydratase in catechol pathway
MRLISYDDGSGHKWGALVDGAVVDLAARMPDCPTLLSAIAAGRLDGLPETISGMRPDVKLADVALLPPIPAPEKIWCIGVNYAERNEEYRDGAERPRYPSLFVRAPSSLVGHGAPILRPLVSEQLDYEGEIVLVIGREGRGCRANAPATTSPASRSATRAPCATGSATASSTSRRARTSMRPAASGRPS